MATRPFVMKTKQFDDAIELYKEATKKDMADVLNRALRNVGYRAAEFTPKKDKHVIEAELWSDKIGLKFITKKLRARIGQTFKTAKGKLRTVRRVTRKQIALQTRQFIARRMKRTGFLRAGWVAALVKAGIKTSGLKGAIIADSKSSLGSGQQATPKKLYARLGNGVWGRLNGKSAATIRGVMQGALRRAMSYVAKDMTDYAKERLGKTARKYSAKA